MNFHSLLPLPTVLQVGDFVLDLLGCVVVRMVLIFIYVACDEEIAMCT